MLRELGGIVWSLAMVGLIALLTFGGSIVHQLGRQVIQRRHLDRAAAEHLSDGSLGVATTTRAIHTTSRAAGPTLAITFTFANDAFAAQVAALHGVEARPDMV